MIMPDAADGAVITITKIGRAETACASVAGAQRVTTEMKN